MAPSPPDPGAAKDTGTLPPEEIMGRLTFKENEPVVQLTAGMVKEMFTKMGEHMDSQTKELKQHTVDHQNNGIFRMKQSCSLMEGVLKAQTDHLKKEGRILVLRPSVPKMILKEFLGMDFTVLPAIKEQRNKLIAEKTRLFLQDHPNWYDPSSVAERKKSHAGQMKTLQDVLTDGYTRADRKDLERKVRDKDRLLKEYIGQISDGDREIARLTAKNDELEDMLDQQREREDRSYAETVAHGSDVTLPAKRQRAVQTQTEPMEMEPAPAQAQGVTPMARPERVPISDPVKFDGDSRKGIDIRVWLRNLERFFKDKNQDPAKFGRYAGHWLSGNAQKVWECELTDMEDKNETPTWRIFYDKMVSFYGSVIPAREHRAEYANCTQKGTVMDFITSLRVILQTLKGTAFAPSTMDVIEHFLKGLKPDVRKYVEDNAPEGWWTDPKDVYDKAIQFETNQHARVQRVQVSPRVNVTYMTRGRFIPRARAGYGRGNGRPQVPYAPDGGRPQGRGRPQQQAKLTERIKGPAVPQPVKAARKAAQECIVCGSKGHSWAQCRHPSCVLPSWYNAQHFAGGRT